MKTQVNSRQSDWSADIWRKWAKCISGQVMADPWQANYFTPRPYVDEYNRGSTEEGFVYTVGRDVWQVIID